MFDALRRPHATLVLAVALGLSGCAGEDGDGDDGSRDVPSDAVAVIGDQQISSEDFDRRLAAVRRSQSAPGSLSSAQLRQQAMATLLQQAWLEREARELGVGVSEREVRRRVADARRQFPTPRAYRRFLGRQTERDLMFQIRVQLLSEAIEQHLAEQGKDSRNLFGTLQRRWSDETACRKALAVPGCDG